MWCPACEEPHGFDDGWQFDGNETAPTFMPSMLVRWREGDRQIVCHSFLERGVWHFLNDCTHALRGQRVEAPDWPLPSRPMAETKPQQPPVADKNDKPADKPSDKPADKAPPAAPTAPPAPAQERAATTPPPVDKPAPADATPAVRRDPEQEERREREALARAKSARVFAAFQGPPLGLPRYAAALLTAHFFFTQGRDAEDAGRTEAIAWAEGYQRQNPVAWFPLKNGDLNAWVKMMDVQKIPHASAEQYRDLAALVASE